MLTHRLVRTTIIFAIIVISLGSNSFADETYSVSGGLAYEKAGNWQGLLDYATAWSRTQPNSIDAWAFIGSAYELGLNQPEKAIDPLRKCVAIDPNSAEAWHALGTAYVKTQ